MESPVLPISNLFKPNGKSSPGRGRDGLVGAVIWMNAGSQLKRSAAGKGSRRDPAPLPKLSKLKPNSENIYIYVKKRTLKKNGADFLD